MKTLVAILIAASTLSGPAPEAKKTTAGILRQAFASIGIRYRFAGNGERGIDCAGLMQRVFSAVGIRLPRTAAEQFREGVKIDRAELQPGDLVFFRDTYKHGISHVGVFVGNGIFVHASSSRRAVVADQLAGVYYDRRFAGARRVLQQ